MSPTNKEITGDCKFKDLTPTGITCPQCNAGELSPARGRFGAIYKCTNT